MTRRRIGRHLTGGMVPDDELARTRREDELREAFSRWASGVSIVAVRSEGRVHALTVSAFIPVSLDPPLVLVSLGPNASALPYLEPGQQYGISILTADQQGLASRFADVFPVGPSPFTEGEPPLVAGALAAFSCVVEEVRPTGDHHLVLGSVVDTTSGGGDAVLLYYRRGYHRIE